MSFQNKINKNEKGVWRYAEFYDEFIKLENRLELNNGAILRQAQDDMLKFSDIKLLKNINHLYFKREDENFCGSLKDKSLAYQISLAKQNNKKELVISTSGNAGIAAAAYCQKAGIKLYIFISPETEKAKIAEMQKYNPIIIKSRKAIRLANYLSAKYKIENLRPSVNNSSIEGFKSIAFEVFENLEEVEAIFTFVTSGSSFVGIGRAYQYLLENKEIKKMPKLYAIQGRDNSSIAGKLGVKNTRRKKEILELIKLSGGDSIYINNNEILKAKNILEKNKIFTSSEGCASFAGIIKVGEKNKLNNVVCILSGKLREEIDIINESKICKAESFEEVDKIANLRRGGSRPAPTIISNPIFFITPNPNRAVGLEKIIKNYYLICSQKTDLVSYFKKEKIPVLCLNNDEIKSSGKILANRKVIKYIKEKVKNKKANIITFKPSPMIQKICEENNFNYLGNDWKLNRKLEDKIEFVGITNKLKIPNAESEVIEIDENNLFLKATFRNVAFKNKYVIQLSRGFSGNSTFLIESKKDLDEILKKYKSRKVKISKYLEGETYTVNACVAGGKILISQPIFQITGLTSYNKNKLGTSGNDYKYGEKLRSGENKKIFNYTKKIGGYLKSLGYKGIFGLDFIVSNGGINIIEINPRLIASIPVFTKLQIQNKEKPFLLSHILEFMNDSWISPEGDIRDISLLKATFRNVAFRSEMCRLRRKNESKFFNVSQLILRNTKNKPIKIIKNLKSGIYEIKKNKLIFKEEAYCIERNLNKNEFLIQCVAKNSVTNPDMEYANIQVNYGIMKDKEEFKPCFDKIIKSVLENINLSF